MDEREPSRQYAELAELAGTFVHEIKNHISTLGLNLQLLAEDFQDPQTPRERKALQRSQRLLTECQRLVDLSNDFLRFARSHEPHREPASLDEVVGEMLDFFTPTARAANITINWYSAPGLPPLLLDRDLFKQALLNLMLNAEQAMPEEGGEITLQACADAGGVRLDVIDTGRGMSPEVLAKVFRPFHTTKPGGNGLGLATTRKIVEAHRGRIDVQSEVGRGTKFSVWLPAGGHGGRA